MPEVPDLGEHHRHVLLIGRIDHFGVTHGAPGLNDSPCTGSNQHIQPVSEGKEGVTRHHRAL